MLDGPAPETLRSLVLTVCTAVWWWSSSSFAHVFCLLDVCVCAQQAFPLILAQLSDPVRLVKDTAGQFSLLPSPSPLII